MIVASASLPHLGQRRFRPRQVRQHRPKGSFCSTAEPKCAGCASRRPAAHAHQHQHDQSAWIMGPRECGLPLLRPPRPPRRGPRIPRAKARHSARDRRLDATSFLRCRSVAEPVEPSADAIPELDVLKQRREARSGFGDRGFRPGREKRHVSLARLAVDPYCLDEHGGPANVVPGRPIGALPRRDRLPPPIADRLGGGVGPLVRRSPEPRPAAIAALPFNKHGNVV